MWGLKRQAQAKPYLNNRRGESEDRRVFGPPTRFPFIDGTGKIIKVDRRSTPDRRLANIQVREDYLDFDTNRFLRK